MYMCVFSIWQRDERARQKKKNEEEEMSVICRRRFPIPRQRATARNKNKYFFFLSIQIKQLKVLPTGKSTESKEMRIITTTFSHNEFKWRSQHSE